ncbi:hypothetical protein DFH06DRAFT_1465676 [Mycena polygramma]|nr:hypothetical protein DFH06DRAFT_1465676 [Mycena polygramma]
MSSTATSISTHDGVPSFPLDIELEIFTAAAMMHEEMIPTLLRVAHRVLIWIESLLYRTLMFRENGHDSTRLSTVIHNLQAKPLAFRENVRDVLWWSHNILKEDDLCTLLSLCTGIENLVLARLNPELVDRISSLRLRRMISPLWPSLLAVLASCTSLTHLWALDYHGYFAFSWLNTLPSLTHLGLSNPFKIDRAVFEPLLKRNKQLRVCVIFSSPFEYHIPDPWMDDDRVVLISGGLDYFRDWKLGVTGGRDSWVRAEELLANKRKDKSITTQICSMDS